MQGFEPDWPAPDYVKVWITTTELSEDSPVYGGNLATHVNDNSNDVMVRRQALEESLHISPVRWLNQTHTNKVLDWHEPVDGIEADGIYSSDGKVCAVLTADCLPVLLASHSRKEVAAVHCGWRGLAQNILEHSVAKFQSSSDHITAYLGPAIALPSFEVGEEVKRTFCEQHSSFESAFLFARRSTTQDHFYANLYEIARLQLFHLGVSQCYGGTFDTRTDQRFFSYRRQPVTGRFASMVWCEG